MAYQNYQYTNYQEFMLPEFFSKFVFECGEFFQWSDLKNDCKKKSHLFAA